MWRRGVENPGTPACQTRVRSFVQFENRSRLSGGPARITDIRLAGHWVWDDAHAPQRGEAACLRGGSLAEIETTGRRDEKEEEQTAGDRDDQGFPARKVDESHGRVNAPVQDRQCLPPPAGRLSYAIGGTGGPPRQIRW